MHYVYILRCANNTYYTGSTANLKARVRAHNIGQAATHTAKHGPVELVYAEPHPERIEALRRERQLKRWSRKKKEALIGARLDELKVLSKRRS